MYIVGVVAFVLGALSLLQDAHAQTAQKSIGYIGCANTSQAVGGYKFTSGNQGQFWKPYVIKGGDIGVWADAGSSLWASYQAGIQANGQPSIVWVQLCVNYARAGGTNVSYDTVVALLANLRVISPNATVVISPTTIYDPIGLCKYNGVGNLLGQGIADTNSWARQAVANGLGQLGPQLGPLDQSDIDSEYPASCLTNNTGSELLGQQLVDFFDLGIHKPY